MESYKMEKNALSEESQKKAEMIENYESAETISVEEVISEKITESDVLSGTEIKSEELNVPAQDLSEETSFTSGEESSLTEQENVSHRAEENISEESTISPIVETPQEGAASREEIQKEIKAEQEYLQTIQDQVVDDEEETKKEESANTPIQDYSTYNKDELIRALQNVLKEGTFEEIRPHVEAIKACFYKIRIGEIQEQKQAFINEGNEEILFVPEQDPWEIELKDLLKEYKNLRAEINKKQDLIKEENYQKKSAIIEEIKSLVHRDESLNLTFQEFSELQEKWRKIGQVPQNKVKDLWENYHYHVELFYDFVKINRELRDLDLRRNYDLKLELCKKAEDLVSNNNDAQVCFKELQKLHESWREIGPVPREGKQELWERFKSATAQINKRYQQYFEQERAVQKEQLQKKIELCEKAELFAGFVSDNPREWNDVTDQVIALQEEWKKFGYGPRKENAKIWERFRAANDAFFQNKRNFWNASKENLNKNLILKTEICEQAEKLKDSEDWKATSDKLITLQKKWKEIGPVPRKQSEIIWKRFRSACDEFFNRKVQHFSGITGDQDENYKAKKALVAEIENFKPSGNNKENIEALKNFQERWSAIGFVPFRKKEELQSQFHNLMEAHFDKLKLDDQDVLLYKFKSKIEHLASLPGGWGKINMERDRLSQHLKQMENDINTLGNNVGFFGSSKGAQSLIEGVNAQIEKIRSQIEYIKTKIKIIDQQDEKV